MIAFETVLAMLASAVVLLTVARKLRLPYPALLAMAGAAVAIAPIDIKLELDPAVVLALFVAPVLLDAAYDTSLRDLRRHWGAVTSLALIAVGLTTLGVAVVVHAMVPTIPWAAAIAVGAIVAPPDAVAATSVLRDVGLPRRIVVILEGEALLNDASALLIYRLAVLAVVGGGSAEVSVLAPAFVLALVASVIVGPVLAWLVSHLMRRITDVPSSIMLQFVSTFSVWIIAERAGLSPILVMVTYAMSLSHSTSAYPSPRLRIPSYAVWETAVLVLNVLAFLLIGLELGPVIASARPGELGHWARVAAAVLITAIVVRLLWSVGTALWTRWRITREPSDGLSGRTLPDWRSGVLVGWAGTRGMVTVATALALPQDFPERGMLLFAAFTVTLGTLLIQGLTLRPLSVALDLGRDDEVGREVRTARVATAEAALAALAEETGDDAEALRAELDTERRIAATATHGDARPTLAGAALRARALAARRARLHALRGEGAIGDEAFHRLEEELDLADLAVATRT